MMRRPFAFLFGFMSALVLLATFARANGRDCIAEDAVRLEMGRMNAIRGPRLVEDATAKRSLNELYRSATGQSDEFSVIWWGDLANGSGLLLFGEPGASVCHELSIPAQHWPMVLRVILGVAV